MTLSTDPIDLLLDVNTHDLVIDTDLHFTSGVQAVLAGPTADFLSVQTPAFSYQIGATVYATPPVSVGSLSTVQIGSNNAWIAVRLYIDTSKVLHVSPGTEQITEAAAKAAVPATPGGNFNVGYFTIQSTASATGRNAFVGATDTLLGGGNAGPPYEAQATNY